MNDRIYELRKELGLTMDKFGNCLGVTKTTISRLEKGERNVTDQMVRSICREFNVREQWLREGVGPIFEGAELDPLDTLLKSRKISAEDLKMVKSVVGAFLELEPSSREAVIQYLQGCAAKLNASATETSPDGDLAAKVESLKKQNQELMARLGDIEKEENEWEREHTKQSISPARSHAQ